MKKFFLITGLIVFTSLAAKVHSQSINNKNWKAYIADPINDTITLHIHSDSSFVTNANGEIFLKTNCVIQGDTLTFSDYNTSEHACPDPGKYKINLNNGELKFSVIEDACDGRAKALDGLVWKEARK